MADLTACASCATTDNLKHCALCKTVSYCSKGCQRAHWQTHKPSCHFKVILSPGDQSTTPTDALALLRTKANPGTKQDVTGVSPVAHKAFNIPELPAIELLATQRVCRSWYLTSANGQSFGRDSFPRLGRVSLLCHHTKVCAGKKSQLIRLQSC